ncbi:MULTISPECIES: hypothetical protein [unclassified Rhizobium]|nr:MULTISPECIES: hypothetical protein [unclassified Rhizobium]MDR6664043.1 hypothetical protein [Rhizobium sp. 1399]UFS81572.1 hypothetical protein LPB79_25200 [Rhizobium sp. T136]
MNITLETIMAATYLPTPFKCATAVEIEAKLSAEVIQHIDARRLSSAEISRRYPTIRLEHLQKLRRGEPLNFRVLSALIEATGAPVNIRVNS